MDDQSDQLNDLDAELFSDTATPQGAPADTKAANQSETPVWRAAGREWKDPAELAKAHDSLTREFSKTKNELKGLSGWREFDAFLGKNPDLRETLAKTVEDYRNRKQSGQSQAQAERGSGIPHEVAAKLEELQAKQDDILLDREINQVQSKYKLDEKQVVEILNFSAANGGMPLEHAYKLWSFDQKQLEAKTLGGKAALEAHLKKQKANVGSSSTSPVAPSPNTPKRMNEADHKATLAKRLEELGFKD